MWIPDCDVAMIMDARAKKNDSHLDLRVDFIASRRKGRDGRAKQWIHPVFYEFDDYGNKVDIMRGTLHYGECCPVHIYDNEASNTLSRLNDYIELLEIAGFNPLSNECVIRNIQCGPCEKAKDVLFKDVHRWHYENEQRDRELKREREQKERDEAEKRRADDVNACINSITMQLERIVVKSRMPRVVSALSSLFRLIDKENLNHYAKMCNGTLRESKYTKELAELKQATEKVLRYSPKVAEFADEYERTRDLISQAVSKLDHESDYFHIWSNLDLKEAKRWL